jgi:hypothetical protein
VSAIDQVFSNNPLQWSKNVDAFEDGYKTNFGIFFTEFVKTNEASYSKLSSKDFEDSQRVLASYNHLSKLATEIGDSSMLILEKLRVFNPDKNTPQEMEKLKIESHNRLQTIMQRCDQSIKEISEN